MIYRAFYFYNDEIIFTSDLYQNCKRKQPKNVTEKYVSG